MVYALLFLLCVVFLELAIRLDLRREVMAIIARSREALRVFASVEISDEHKGTFMRRESLAMLKATALFALKFAFIFVLLYTLYLGIVAFFPDLESRLLESFVSPPVIVILTIATGCYAWARNAVLKQL